MGSVAATEMLVRGGIDPALLRHHLRRVDPDRTTVRVAPAWFRMLWAKGIVAVCMPWSIYVHPEIMERFERGDRVDSIATLMAHELTHLEQYRRLGLIRHTIRYVGDYLLGRRRGLRHWDAYRAIGLEREARHVAAVITVGSHR